MAVPPLGQNHEALPGGVLGPTTLFSLEVTSKSDGPLWIDVQHTQKKKKAKLFLIKASEAGECQPAFPLTQMWVYRTKAAL